MRQIYNWGIYPKIEAEEVLQSSYETIAQTVRESEVLIARGNGRCYGDSSLQKTMVSSLSLNKFISFDEKAGILTCQAGVLLSEILTVTVPKGYFLPVTPGTKFVTLGGAVASNIHGKNHHKDGAIGSYIESFELMTSTGDVLHCSKDTNRELFADTIGGMGLTGIILSVSLRLKRIESSYIKLKSIKAKNLDEILELFKQYNQYTYSVAWIDCLSKGDKLGRSILMLGEHALAKDLNEKQKKHPLAVHSAKQFRIPFFFPSFVLSPFSVRLFNMLYYYKQRKKEINKVVHYNPYFYPLDIADDWNKIYGTNGFTQYQFVVPFEKGNEALRKIVAKIASAGCGSFLAVLKTLRESESLSSPLSFPMPGYTLALDFKVNKKVFALLDELDVLVKSFGGRLYLTKDARMTKQTFHETYKPTFTHASKFSSLQSHRLEI